MERSLSSRTQDPAGFCLLIAPSYRLPIGHFTVMNGSESEVDLVLIQTFLLYNVNQVILMVIIVFFKDNFHNKANKVCIRTRSPSTSYSLEG